MGTAWARRLSVLLCLLLACVALPVGGAEAGGRPRLSFEVRGGGTTYVAGQGVYLVGDLGVRGVHPISVQSHLNRPGDRWLPLVGITYHGRTDRDGSFRMPIQAPGMFGISYRVVGAGRATPGVTFNAKTQDVDLWVEGSQDYTRPVQPLSLLPFTIVADTTPQFYRRPTTDDLPVLVGRRLTLLERTSPGTWDVVGRTTAGEDGRGRFTGLVEEPGDHVYRVRAERWTRNGSKVGWMWSWPINVHVLGLLELPSYEPEGERTPGNVAGQRGPERPNRNAGATFGWGPVRWDYAWTAGQSLDDPPARGTDRRGRWAEMGTGLGRVVKHNGGLMVSSGKQVRDGRGDWGTTRAVLQGASAAYGRWEATLSLATGEKDHSDYDVVLELVPTSGADRPCAPSITVARWTGLGTRMSMGAARGGRTWTRTIDTQGVAHDIPIVAAEVAPGHVTWFLNGRAVGSVRSRKAVPGVPLTMRISLEGDTSEHDSSDLHSDWQRAYPLHTGRQVTRAPALRVSARRGC